MAYTDTSQLPDQVKGLLSPSYQERWLSSYDVAFKTHGDENRAINEAWINVLRNAYPEAQQMKNSELPNFTPVDASEVGTFSFITTLDGVALEENEQLTESWLQALPLGTYMHPRYGKMEITPERIARFVENINNEVRGTLLDIDYEHKESTEGGRAAGWVVAGEDRGADGLWIKVRWTPKAVQALKDKEYLYFSPEFADSWAHPKSLQVFKDVLFGGALTNRPFLKDILPINLSEMVTGLQDVVEPPKNEPTEEERREMALVEELRKLFGLADDKTEDDILTAVKANQDLLGTVRQSLALDEKDDVAVKCKELVDFKANVTKDDEKARKFAEEYPEEAKRLEELALEAKENSVDKKLTEWKKNPKSQIGIPVKLHEDVKNYRMSIEGDIATKFDELMEKIVETGTVDFSERGSSEIPPISQEEDVEFLTVVKKYQDEDKISYRDAVKKATETHPKLAQAWADNVPVISSAGGDE